MRYYPERKPREGSWPARNRSIQARFRKAVLAAAGDPPRCQYLDGYGIQCNVTGAPALVAHHREPGNPDPATGVALCQHHHRVVDKHAR